MDKSPTPLPVQGFQTQTGVSRETLDRLRAYWALVEKWQPRVNLVGPSTLADPWRRHMLDSAQLAPLVPEGTAHLIDLGSGAGFPGLVLAILGVAERITLIESDQRKAVFLREAARITEAPATVVADRIERAAVPPADIITARALAPLDKLVQYARRFAGPHTRALFLKGQDVEAELTAATRDSIVRVDSVPSQTAPGASILVLEGLNG